MNNTSNIEKGQSASLRSGEWFGWIDCKERMPDGWERKVFAWIVWPDGCGWRDHPEPVVAWWKHGPLCFAYQDVENANHLVTHWMEIPTLLNAQGETRDGMARDVRKHGA